MGHRNRAPIRLEIVGLSEWILDACRNSIQAISLSNPSNARGRSGVTETLSAEVQTKIHDVPKDLIDLHSKVALMCVDFERAYGRRVEIKVYERSPNKFLNIFSRTSKSEQTKMPEFFINGVMVYKGVPNSFSELDEAIDKAFGNYRPQRI